MSFGKWYLRRREQQHRLIKDEKAISDKLNTAQAIWQVGKGDGVFLDILNNDGTIKDFDFFNKLVA